jgi:hypothetical protein
MLLTELTLLKNSNELISIERDCHDEELTGYLIIVSENIIGMNLIDNDGVFEGFTLFETAQINEVFWGNREHKAIDSLANKVPRPVAPQILSTEFQPAVLEIEKLFSSISIHSHHSEDKFDLGEIIKSDDEWVKICTFGTKKTLSRMNKLFLRECISRVVVNSPYQNKIVELSANKY